MVSVTGALLALLTLQYSFVGWVFFFWPFGAGVVYHYCHQN